MADSKITALTAISTVDPTADPLVIVDVSDTSMAASGTTKKSTINQLLGAGGTATLASATITGDLTVDTSTLKVDSANNRVGINNASPTVALDVVGSGLISTGLVVGTSATNNAVDIVGPSSGSNAGCQLAFKNGATTNAAIGTYSRVIGGAYNESLAFYSNSKDFVFYTGSERYRIASDGVATWSNVGGVAGTAMTLNATGLGVGDAPTADCKLTVKGGAFINRGAAGGASQLLVSLAASSGGNFGQISNTGTRWALGYGSTLTTVGTEALIWDSSGNVGIGVSAFGTSAAKVLGLANATAPSTSPAGMGQLYVEAGALKYRGSSGTVTTIANA